MQNNINSSSLFTSTIAGLQNVYQLVDKEELNGITKEELEDFDSSFAIGGQSFLQFISQNFDDLDKDGNSTISNDEMSSALNQIQSQGMTYQQLLTLATQSSSAIGVDKTLLETVITNFQEIDKNYDGKVSMAEINAYNVGKEVDEKEKELQETKYDDLSVFYGSSSSDSDDITTSTYSTYSDS